MEDPDFAPFQLPNFTVYDVVESLDPFPEQVLILSERVLSVLNEVYEIGEKAVDSSKIENALRDCDALLDWSWERLNTGMWATVPVCFRRFLAYHRLLECGLKRLLKGGFCCDIERAISMLESLDNGLIMSPDLEGTFLSKSAQRIHDDLIRLLESPRPKACATQTRWKQVLSRVTSELSLEDCAKSSSKVSIPLLSDDAKCRPVERRRTCSLDLLEFERAYLGRQTPVVLVESDLNLSQRKWCFETLLRRLAFRTVPVEIGSSYTDADWTQRLVKFVDFVSWHVLEPRRETAYLAQHNLLAQIPALAADFAIPDYCAATSDKARSERLSDVDSDDDGDDWRPVELNAWIGPGGTVSPLHTDPRDNIFSQLLGRKYVRIVSSKAPKEQVYPLDGLTANTSAVNVESPDRLQHSGFLSLPPELVWETVLGPGEALFIPAGHWHFVKSLEPSVSISAWFN